MKRPKLGRNWKIGLIVLAAMAMASTVANRQIVINTSPSVQPGLYVRSTEPPRVGAIVDFRIPPSARQYVFARTGNSGADWYILKPVVAGPGDRVDTMGECLVINGRRLGPMPSQTDDGGRPLPVWRENRVLAQDEFFVFSNRIPNSFDSRCYGPIQRQHIEAVRRPLLVW